MISFIVIGRNEGKKLTKCFQSIFKTISDNNLIEYEVVYVDSKSTDNSIEIARGLENISIIQLSGEINAAIGRNVGALFAKGDILFFIDGDMEIMPDFLALVYNEKDGLKYDFVSGQMNYIYYDDNENLIGQELYFKKSLNKDAIYYTVGGLFLIKRNFWDLLGGMDNRYKKSEDYDLALKLALKKVHLIRKKEIIGNTHMISYKDHKRMYSGLFDKSHLYSRSLIYREHFFNKYMWPSLIRNDSSLIVLLVSTFICILSNNYLLFLLYPLFVIVRILKRNNNLSNLLINVPYYFIRDIVVIFGFFFFYPKKIVKRDIKFTVVN